MAIDFKPYDYQAYAIDKIIDNKRFGLFLDMGLGKTVSTLTAIEQLKYDYLDVDKVLVIAPKRVAEDTWAKEVDKWTHLTHLDVSLVLGTPKQREQALEKNADIYVTNKENTKWICERYKKDWPFDMVVIDELSTFKNSDSQRFKILKKKWPLFDRFVGLTGTPAPKNIMDLWAQIYLIDGGKRLGKFKTHFRQRYFYPTHQISDNVFNWELKNGSKDEIYKMISDVTVSMESKDYLKMPERVDTVKEAKLSKRERVLYDELEQNMVIENDIDDDKDIVALNSASLSNKLLQMSNGAVYADDGSITHIHDRKLELLDEIVEESQGQPILVMYNYKHDKERLLERYDFAETLDSDDYMERWNNGEIQMLITHPASAGHGLNLQYGGSIMVWFGLTWNLEYYEQANARLYRQGQKKTTVIHHLLTENSIDQKVYESLKNKKLGQNELMNAVKARLL
ncbi:DEAD/DEAH box helicase [Staphylococcus pseudoxylosus]|uniref:DEAD/DEAH box helicase n=1 Tax=Staphylococcus pseudoxylosus TaxID=2282419 RepID=UPI002DBEBF15|nr:DEAD/DEAH box helicase [Staphylococcus pseudoxylosus]MEB6060833.1 DEAD/DEAH box helicase [Staphylococcus pseudoxylosus]